MTTKKLSPKYMPPKQFHDLFLGLLETDSVVLKEMQSDPMMLLEKFGFDVKSLPPDPRDAFFRKMRGTEWSGCSACAFCAICSIGGEIDGASGVIGLSGVLGLALD